MQSWAHWQPFGGYTWQMRAPKASQTWWLSGQHGVLCWGFEPGAEAFLERVRDACGLTLLDAPTQTAVASMTFGVDGPTFPDRTLCVHAAQHYIDHPQDKRSLWQAWLEFDAQGWYTQGKSI